MIVTSVQWLYEIYTTMMKKCTMCASSTVLFIMTTQNAELIACFNALRQALIKQGAGRSANTSAVTTADKATGSANMSTSSTSSCVAKVLTCL